MFMLDIEFKKKKIYSCVIKTFSMCFGGIVHVLNESHKHIKCNMFVWNISSINFELDFLNILTFCIVYRNSF